MFSLGIVLYELATGRRPFEGDNNLSILSSILRERQPSISDLRPRLPRGLDRVIERCLHKDAATRYSDAGELKQELARLQSAADRDGRRGPSRRQWMSAMVVAVVVGLLAVVTWNIRRSSRVDWARTVAIPADRRATR